MTTQNFTVDYGIQISGEGGNITGATNIEASGNVTANAIVGAQSGNINIVADSSNWVFDTDGNLQLPGNLVYIGASPAPTINGFGSATFVDGVIAGNMSSVSGSYQAGVATVINDGINAIYTGSSTTMDVFGFPFTQLTRGQLTISGDITPTEALGTWYYQSVNTTTFEIFTDSTYSTPVDSTSWAAYSGGAVVYITKNLPAANLILDSNGFLTTFDNTGNITASGNIKVNSVTGNLVFGRATATGSPGMSSTSSITFAANRAGTVQAMTLGLDGNLYVPGSISATNLGNIASANLDGSSSNVLYGNGAFAPVSGSYGDSNVVTLLGSFGSNTVSTTGNVTTGNVVFGANTGQVAFHTGAYISGNANSITRDGSIVLQPYTGAGSTFPGVVIGGAGRLIAPNGSVSQIFNTADVTFQVAAKVTVGTASTTTTTGALIVTGGTGISGNLNVGGNISGGNIIGNGNTLSNVATKTTGTWSLAAGVNTTSISVPGPGTYSIWVNGNIPNGIITYTATAVVTNNNVPVLGQQFAWYYATGNALVFTSIPDQFVGTAGSISTATPYGGTTANVFVFGVTNNSGTTQIVNWGYTKL